MTLLRSLDLFTGVAGLTRALEGIAEPVTYCDIAPESHANLEANMSLGLIPRAPISTDVRSLNAKWLSSAAAPGASKPAAKGKPQMIAAGFPCVGFSSVGLRQAFKNSQSSLFSEILRLVDEFKLPVVFLENVAGILTLGMNTVVHELATVRGYELRWCVVSAEDVGAPQVRKRWFCLGVKPGFTFEFKNLKYKKFSWDKELPADARMRCRSAELTKEERLRIGLLGNSVVPDAVRTAFVYLASGFAKDARLDQPRVSFAKVNEADLKPVKTARAKVPVIRAPLRWPTAGCVTPDGLTFAAPKVSSTSYLQQVKKALDKKRFKIVLDPKSFKTKKPPSPLLQHTPLQKEFSLPHWGTPRYSITGAANYITQRTSRDLPTQVRFEKKTPQRLKACELEARFVEWLMGYPRDWTRQHA